MADGNKTEKATPKRRQDERKKGNIFQSKDVTSVFGLIILTSVLKIIGPFYLSYLKQTVTFYFNKLPNYKTINAKEITAINTDIIGRMLILVLPLAVTASIAGILFTFAQTRLNFSKDRIKFKFSRVNFFSGIKNIISLKSLVELLKSLIKITTISCILYSNISSNLDIILRLMRSDILQAFYWICNTMISIIFNICIIMMGFMILDYLYQWWEYERKLMMTKQEIKDENKQTEGDPQVKGKIKERQRSMANMRMMQKVPEADFIVRNPTHYAVAIKYDPNSKKNKAPVVIAKGQGYIALKIIEIAEEHKITVTENKPLARALYQSVKVGREIPSEFYQAVAEVLAFVYNLKKKERLYEIKK